ncbi:MAG: hypothetical protein KDD04_06335 [Sinomicrobium sp.]|nr:hypothetical protein [Sinomicrobium sp.]
MTQKPYFWPGITFLFALFVLFCFAPADAAQTKQAVNTLDAYAPFEEVLQVTPSDSTTYSPPFRGCIVESDGDLAILPKKNTSSVTITVITGQMVPAMITKVLSTGTTATVVCGR